jgi:hypothetical protein
LPNKAEKKRSRLRLLGITRLKLSRGSNNNLNLLQYRPFDRARIIVFAKVIADNATEAIRQLERGYEQAIPPNAVLPVFSIDDWQTVVWTIPHAPNLKNSI